MSDKAEIKVHDVTALRAAQLAASGASDYQEIFQYILLENTGSIVGTDGFRIWVADDAHDHTGEDVLIRFEAKLPNVRGPGTLVLSDDISYLKTDKGTHPLEHRNDMAYPAYRHVIPTQRASIPSDRIKTGQGFWGVFISQIEPSDG